MFSDTAQKLSKPGTVGVIPTDTVYGLVARASDQAAVARLYALKQRDSKPGTLIGASIDQLVELGVTRRYLKSVEQFWPGAVSVIIPCGLELRYLHLGNNGIPIRIPDNPALITLLRHSGPLLTSSANHPGQALAVNIDQAKNYFGDSVDFYVDGGDLSANKPSTIIRIVDDAIELIRAGAVEIDARSL